MEIQLTQGKVAIVDDSDFEWLSRFKWRALTCKDNPHCCYAITGDYVKEKGQKAMLMHRIILGAHAGVEVDHINNNGLDNRRINLRICSHAENIRNQSVQNGKKSSKYRGVSLHKATGSWTAQIQMRKTKYHLGYFKSESDAAVSYDKKAKQIFGQFAKTNFKEVV